MSIECKRIGPDLESLIDKELAAKRKHLVEEHLLLCDACSQKKVRLERLKNSLNDAKAPQLGKEFDDNLLIAIKDLDGSKRKNMLWPLVASFVIAAPLILMMVTFMTNTSKQQSSFVSNDLQLELQTIGKQSEIHAVFHQSTQIEGNLLCINASADGDCYQDPKVLIGINQG